MDLIKNIKLILDNPANDLTTTSRDLLESTVVALELKEVRTFEQKKDDMIEKMGEFVKDAIFLKGEESKEFSEKVLKPDNEFMFNLEGVGSPYVTEVAEDKLICNYGHTYSYDCLGIDELCQLIDHLKEKY